MLRDSWPIKLMLVLLGTLFGFLLAEGAVRLHHGDLWTPENFLEEELNLFLSACPAAFDPALGWIPRPGASGTENIWKTEVTISAAGTRSNGAAQADGCRAQAPAILTVGDSFTFGDEVSDAESWPAHLQRQSGYCVVNGGVFGYGLDQAVLRAEKLVPEVDPRLLIVGLFYGDVARCELSMLAGVGKPFFDVADQRLVLRNQPLTPPTKSVKDLGPLQRTLGHSLVFHKLMKRTFPAWWVQGTMEARRVHDRGGEVAALLMDRLAELQARSCLPVLVVALYDRHLTPDQTATTAPVLARARRSGLLTLDLAPALQDLRQKDPAAYQRLYKGHMTSDGNRFVARAIRTFLEAHRLLPIPDVKPEC